MDEEDPTDESKEATRISKELIDVDGGLQMVFRFQYSNNPDEDEYMTQEMSSLDDRSLLQKVTLLGDKGFIEQKFSIIVESGVNVMSIHSAIYDSNAELVFEKSYQTKMNQAMSEEIEFETDQVKITISNNEE